MDTIAGSKPPQPLAATAGAESAAMQAQVLKSGNTQKDPAAEVIVPDKDGATPPKKAAENGLKNYFVGDPYIYNGRLLTRYCQRVFSYGTKLDFSLILLCCSTSIGSGIAVPLMQIVFGPFTTATGRYLER
jgi:ATP-binding cassette subfamily B (MDR/TAP) protein 1